LWEPRAVSGLSEGDACGGFELRSSRSVACTMMRPLRIVDRLAIAKAQSLSLAQQVRTHGLPHFEMPNDITDFGLVLGSFRQNALKSCGSSRVPKSGGGQPL
jgi:hypothetical protein